MKPGHVLDTEIALKIIGLEVTDPFSVPPYSTDIWHCYGVVNKLQLMGWACNVKSNVTASGILSYTAKFYKDNMESQSRANSLPMAICMAAQAIAREEYIEFVGDEKGSPQVDNDAEIIDMNSLLNKAGLEPVNIEEDPVEDLLIDEIASIVSGSIFVCNQDKQYEMSKLLSKLRKRQIIPNDLPDIIPIQLAQQIIDRLFEKGYLILKKK